MHLVAWRDSQVLGIDFSENYLLVVINITIHILLLMVIHFGFSGKIVNVETAFLFQDWEEEIYMMCPQCMSNIKKDDCIILNKSIYGIVQAVRQCYKKCWNPEEIRIHWRQS